MSTLIAFDEALPEVATDCPSHSGHLIVRAIACTWSSGDAGPVDRVPMMSAPIAMKHRTSQCMRRLPARATTEPRDQLGDGVRIDAADELGGDGPVRGDEVRLGDLRHAVLEGDLAARVVDDRPVAAVLLEERLHRAGVVLEDDADDVGHVAAGQLHELGVLLLAWDAPRGEEVHQHPLAVVAAEVERLALDRLRLDLRRGLADERAALDPLARGVAGGEHDDEQRDDHADDHRRDEGDMTAPHRFVPPHSFTGRSPFAGMTRPARGPARPAGWASVRVRPR